MKHIVLRHIRKGLILAVSIEAVAVGLCRPAPKHNAGNHELVGSAIPTFCLS